MGSGLGLEILAATIEHLRGLADALEQELRQMEEEQKDKTLFVPPAEWIRRYGPGAPGNPFPVTESCQKQES